MKKIQGHIADLVQEVQNYTLDHTTINQYKKRFLGKKGSIQSLFTQLLDLPIDERKLVGRKINELKKLAQDRYERAKATLDRPQKLKQKRDATLPLPPNIKGSIHLLTQIEHEIVSILYRIGFKAVTGPEIEDEWHNFSALNFPLHHPARDMQDTFFLTTNLQEKMFLRTQTSSVQVRIMEQKKMPIRILSVGRVFRKETISKRSHCIFHQVEVLYINKRVSFIDLKDTLHYFVHSLFGRGISMRLRPSFFPFTEPSAEIDITCLLCQAKGCSICKNSGWVEIGGAGMVDPNVLDNCGISPEVYMGFAFGIGIERIAMLLAQIPDIRLFFENDLRFLQQFRGSMIN